MLQKEKTVMYSTFGDVSCRL